MCPMPRPVWSGTISFGLVAIPIKLFHAVSKKSVSFNQLDDRTMSRIRMKKVSADTGEDVPDEHIIKGYELSKTQVVTLTQEELHAADPERDRTIGIEEFVKLDEVDPLQVDQSYYVSPEGRSAKAYALLAQALEKSGQVAIARIVLSTKQHLCMLRSTDGRMVLTTLVWADEVREVPEVPRTTVGGKELQMAEQLVRSMSGKFQPSKFKDEHRSRVEALIRKKAKGQPIEVPEAPKAERVVDLARALEQSLAAARKGPDRPAARARPARARRQATPARARARRR